MQRKKEKKIELESPSRVGTHGNHRQEEQHPYIAQQLNRNLNAKETRLHTYKSNGLELPNFENTSILVLEDHRNLRNSSTQQIPMSPSTSKETDTELLCLQVSLLPRLAVLITYAAAREAD